MQIKLPGTGGSAGSNADLAPWHRGSASLTICVDQAPVSIAAVLVLAMLLQTKLPGTGAVPGMGVRLQACSP